jgi:hypothetical protein
MKLSVWRRGLVLAQAAPSCPNRHSEFAAGFPLGVLGGAVVRELQAQTRRSIRPPLSQEVST